MAKKNRATEAPETPEVQDETKVEETAAEQTQVPPEHAETPVTEPTADPEKVEVKQEEEKVEVPEEPAAPATEQKSEEQAPVQEAPKAPKAEETTKLDNTPSEGFKETEASQKIEKAAAPVEKHSRQYYELKSMLDDYVQTCSVHTINREKLKKRMYQANAIARHVMRYPFKEVVELLYSTVTEKRVTIFSAENMMVMTNHLPQVEQHQYGAFWNVLTQLADKKLKGLRITYRTEAVRVALRKDELIQQFDAIRKRLED